MLDFSIKFVKGTQGMNSLSQRLCSITSLALDIETVNWWDRKIERVALIQLAFRESQQLKVAIIDSLEEFNPEHLRFLLESSTLTKAIHNAAFDAVRLRDHFGIHTHPVHDTMLAARRGGEKRYSLKAQTQAHLGIQLEKSEQRGDWSRRPLTTNQLRYAAMDAACTLLLYEDQLARGVGGSYQLRDKSQELQTSLPLSDISQSVPVPVRNETSKQLPIVESRGATEAYELNTAAIALLGVVTELAGQYSPERLSVSSGSERVGIAGWIIDKTLVVDMDIDEETARVEIAELCERGLARLNESRRLEATESGARLWAKLKPV